MKKQRKSKPKPKAKQTQTTATKQSRRSFMTSLPYWAAGVVVAGGLGFFGVSTVRADLAEQDLSIVGSGVPVVVQVHDPSCSICQALQKETRAALAMMDGDSLPYRVASIT